MQTTQQTNAAGGKRRGPPQAKSDAKGHTRIPSKGTKTFSSSEDSSSSPADLQRDRLLYLTAHLIGLVVEVQVRCGTVYEGIFHSATMDKDFGVILKMVKKKNSNSVSFKKESSKNPVLESIVIYGKDFVQMAAADVDVNYAVQHVPRTNDSFVTDTDISNQFGEIKERHLEKWTPDGELEGGLGLEDAGSKPWDQFAENEKLFGVKAEYNEELYTTKLNKNAENYSEKEREADRIAREIMSGDTSNVHLAEERGQILGQDYDEEQLYGAVMREKEASRPPASSAESTGKYIPPNKRAQMRKESPAISSPQSVASGTVTPTNSQSEELKKMLQVKGDEGKSDDSGKKTGSGVAEDSIVAVKSKLNPNAKSFAFSPGAKSFTPGSSSAASTPTPSKPVSTAETSAQATFTPPQKYAPPTSFFDNNKKSGPMLLKTVCNIYSEFFETYSAEDIKGAQNLDSAWEGENSYKAPKALITSGERNKGGQGNASANPMYGSGYNMGPNVPFYNQPQQMYAGAMMQPNFGGMAPQQNFAGNVHPSMKFQPHMGQPHMFPGMPYGTYPGQEGRMVYGNMGMPMPMQNQFPQQVMYGPDGVPMVGYMPGNNGNSSVNNGNFGYQSMYQNHGHGGPARGGESGQAPPQKGPSSRTNQGDGTN
eukprot:Nk52_evm12s248 gene=Nk52_evmTU12s248